MAENSEVLNSDVVETETPTSEVVDQPITEVPETPTGEEVENPVSEAADIQTTDGSNTDDTTDQASSDEPNTTDITNATTNTPTTTNTGDQSSYNADYQDLSQGVDDIQKAVTGINDSIQECNTIIKDIFNEATFYGPFADYCHGTWTDLATLTMNTNNTLNTSSAVLEQTSENYAASDAAVSEKVGDI